MRSFNNERLELAAVPGRSYAEQPGGTNCNRSKSINDDIETFRAVAFAGVESALGRFDGKLTAVELLLFNELGKNNLEFSELV